jgi:hypothetical protein
MRCEKVWEICDDEEGLQLFLENIYVFIKLNAKYQYFNNSISSWCYI